VGRRKHQMSAPTLLEQQKEIFLSGLPAGVAAGQYHGYQIQITQTRSPKKKFSCTSFRQISLTSGVHITGSCGIVGGSAAAIAQQNPRVFVYTFGTGINCFLLGTTYSGTYIYL